MFIPQNSLPGMPSVPRMGEIMLALRAVQAFLERCLKGPLPGASVWIRLPKPKVPYCMELLQRLCNQIGQELLDISTLWLFAVDQEATALKFTWVIQVQKITEDHLNIVKALHILYAAKLLSLIHISEPTRPY